MSTRLQPSLFTGEVVFCITETRLGFLRITFLGRRGRCSAIFISIETIDQGMVSRSKSDKGSMFYIKIYPDYSLLGRFILFLMILNKNLFLGL